MTEPTKTDWAYLAGVVDADGCIHVHPLRSGGTRRNISITNTSPELVDWVSEHFGGTIVWRHGSTSNLVPVRKKRIAQVSWQSKANILRIGHGIRPFVIIKGDKLDELFAEIAASPGAGRPGQRRKLTCKRGHSLVDIPVGTWCPICKRDYYREKRRLANLSYTGV